ncbi:MAG: hypothetical protein KDE26_13540 [Bacteroidetes bacterium]|nr:hypothetical protein [Bacteroidota bacterium]
MNNSIIKNYLLVAIGATTLALSCTSARELSQQKTHATPVYQAYEENDDSTDEVESEPDYTSVLNNSQTEDNQEEENVTANSGLMLPSDLDQSDAGLIASSELEINDLNLEEETTYEEEPATIIEEEVMQEDLSDIPPHSSTVEPVANHAEVQRRDTRPTANHTNKNKEHYTVIITTDEDGMNSEMLLSQLEDAIASIKNGAHRDVTVEEGGKIVENQPKAVQTPKQTPKTTPKPINNPKDEVTMIDDQANEFDESLEQLLEEEINKAPSPALTARKNTNIHGGITKMSIGDGKAVVIDEGLLIEWENGVAAKKLGFESETDMPKWLLQGIEWLTHAPKEEPVRSQVIMPVYRYMKNNGILDDVDQTKMSPTQVVEKLRVFVDEVRASQ